VVIPSITNPFYPEFVRGIEDKAQRTAGKGGVTRAARSRRLARSGGTLPLA
jgi:DNA-binding LacI/PurR family transcriptional regulator